MTVLSDSFGIFGVIGLVFSWIYQGFNLKFIDKIVDDGKQVHVLVKWSAMLVSAAAAGFFMCIDAFTGGCVIALIIGMILANKIDDKLWFVQIVLVLGAYIAFINIFIMINPSVIANFVQFLAVFAAVLVFSVLDEVVHDASEKRASRLLKIVGGWRMLMKIAVAVMAFLLPGIVAWYHVLAWWCFDMMYELESRRGIMKKGCGRQATKKQQAEIDAGLERAQ